MSLKVYSFHFGDIKHVISCVTRMRCEEYKMNFMINCQNGYNLFILFVWLIVKVCRKRLLKYSLEYAGKRMF
ncbi:hypothetical protein Avbf_18070 [Armadillidium vulgare]|nr:hypothetical protein Avbf_18070 [Armadillidium vulgare]